MAAAWMDPLALWTNEVTGLLHRAKTGQRHGAMTPSLFWAGCAVLACSIGLQVPRSAETRAEGDLAEHGLHVTRR